MRRNLCQNESMSAKHKSRKGPASGNLAVSSSRRKETGKSTAAESTGSETTSTARKPKTHHLKTWSPYFEDIRDKKKFFEVRTDDGRDFQVGDTLVLEHYDPEWRELTGAKLSVMVTYILPGGQFGIEKGFVVMGIS